MKISKTILENKSYEDRWAYLIRGCNRKALYRFLKFHNNNRHIFRDLLEKAEEQWTENWYRTSVWLMLNIIRWGPGATVDMDSKYKINNNYFAFYARLLMARRPKFVGWIEIKSFKGQLS